MSNGSHLNDFDLSEWPQTDTHTQKEMDLVGLYSALQPRRIVQLGVRIWPGTWPPRAVSPTPTYHGGTRTHDPESNESTILAATNDDTNTMEHLRHDHHHHEEPEKDRRPPKDRRRRLQTKDQRAQMTSQEQRAPTPDTITFLILPCPRRWGDPL